MSGRGCKVYYVCGVKIHVDMSGRVKLCVGNLSGNGADGGVGCRSRRLVRPVDSHGAPV